VDGIHHAWATQVVGDALRHDSIALSGDAVLRLPVLGLRVCPELFFDQIEEALTTAGWSRSAAAECGLLPDVIRFGCPDHRLV
jgi:hypothetical protein